MNRGREGGHEQHISLFAMSIQTLAEAKVCLRNAVVMKTFT